MGRPETDIVEGMPQRTLTRRIWTVCKVFLVGALLVTMACMVGQPIQMVPWPRGPDTAYTPVLSLRSVYSQSTPQPPSSLVALSVQGTHAGRMALRAWYDDQAAMARPHGYSFPFRMRRWTQGRGARERQVLGRANVDSQLTVQHPLALTANAVADSGPMVAEYEVGAQSMGPERVAASGTSRMLHRLRAEYLSSEHGRRHSYWSATPTRANNTLQPDNTLQSGNTSHALGAEGKWMYYVDDGLLVPNVTDKATLVHIARMVANAYQPTDSETWERLGDRWDAHDSFGWAEDGIRGHVFADADNTTVVVAIKGTSSTFFLGGGSETSARDKFNDNRLFSCCCAYVDFTWATVCDCHMSGSKCNATCLQDAMNDETSDNYFFAAAQIFMDVVKQYPTANIVFAGHSLGGAVAGLLGITFGLPAVGIEAPGDRLAAKRLHLPVPPAGAAGRVPLFHVGHTADPVYMGVCSGRTSTCYYAGYAMESRCHNGQQLVFDTVARRGWRVDMRHHRINEVIYLALEPWGNTDPEERMPTLEPEDKDCVDCGLWKFVYDDSPQ
ncbi:putative lipase atg15 [Coemansia sp. RSA 1199]|nr:putative lipase atg15 [Coemansia sp. RSA 1199]